MSCRGIEGVAEVWARGAYHCPYCHGWEVRDEPLAAYGAGATKLALLLTSLSDDVVLLTDGNSDLDPGEAQQLRQTGVVIRDDPVARLEAEGGKLARVVFADGSADDRTGLFFMPSFTPSPLPGAAWMRTRRVGRGTHRRGWPYEHSRGARRRRDDRQEVGRAGGCSRVPCRLLDQCRDCPGAASGRRSKQGLGVAKRRFAGLGHGLEPSAISSNGPAFSPREP